MQLFLWKLHHLVRYRQKLEGVDTSGLEEQFTTEGRSGSGKLVEELGIEVWIGFVS